MVVNGGGVTAYKITPEKAEKLWDSPTGENPRVASPLVFQDYVYLDGACHSSGALRCLDLKTGELKWNPRKFCAESSSPVLADGKIIAPLEENEDSFYFVMYRATPEKSRGTRPVQSSRVCRRFARDRGRKTIPAIEGFNRLLRFDKQIIRELRS